ncbi:hypothetical protein Poli38472_004634 [Pythium oligandrum]|uniref:FYVE zinc finger domain-containing protein n=1 Tax=Pythium oligandrum TaxID=41045 RepID=A0A8K1FDM0_PYTOL|nr:hypothetical protein Poli38472_004634 [Pythium oligandrum]|eukprot:TMW59565.1 hypothetical protein Poli38472_004634 [Pythium oligandrum]
MSTSSTGTSSVPLPLSRAQSEPFPTRPASMASSKGSSLDRRQSAAPSYSLQKRGVKLSDRRLTAIAQEAVERIPWSRILQQTEIGPGGWSVVEKVNRFGVYTRQESQRYAVLSVGVLPCSPVELLPLMQSTSEVEYNAKMAAMFEEQYKCGSYIYQVDLDGERLAVKNDLRESELKHLSVKTATFRSSKWLASPEEWCFLDIMNHQENTEVYEKVMASLHPDDVVGGKVSGRVKQLNNMVAGYMLKADEVGNNGAANSTRVHFYAEVVTPRRFGFALPSPGPNASERATKKRVLQLAKSCQRFEQLIRRKRLGIQVLADRNRFWPPSASRCTCCDKVLILAKLCRLCGHAVCESCSGKHEREGRTRNGMLRVESVRVCERCVARVDAANYTTVATVGVKGTVIPDPEGAKPAGAVLTDLLQDALVNAPSHERKMSVMNVIKAVLNQDSERISADRVSNPPAVLTPVSSEQEYVYALQTELKVDQIPLDQCDFANSEERSYQIQPGSDPSVQMTYPIGDKEEQRVKVIRESGVRELGTVDELNIICSIAAKEIGCFASLITILDKDDQYVAAANLEMLEKMVLPREHSFCTHTVLENKPFVVPHPEADVRFHKNIPVEQFGVRYYCGFPMVGEDNETIIGSVCCLDQQARELTESQYAMLKRLAQTASKVVKVQTEARRKRSMAIPEHQPVAQPVAQAAA